MTRWIVLLAASAVLLAACGPARATPSEQATAVSGPTADAASDGVVVPTVEGAPEATALPASPTPTPDPLATLDPSGQRVTLWHPYEGATAEALAALVADFNATNEPGVTVALEAVPDRQTLFQRAEAALAAGEGPSLVVASLPHVTTYAADGTLVDLEPYATSGTWGLPVDQQETISSFFWGADGDTRAIAVPLLLAIDVLIVNEALLGDLGDEGPPESWQSLADAACAATEAGARGLGLTTHPSRFAALAYAFGARDLLGEQGYHLDQPAAVEAMQRLQSLVERDCATLFETGAASQQAFGAGTLLFAIDSSATLPGYRQAVERGYGGAWRVTPLPAAPGAPLATVYGDYLALLQGSPESQLAAWTFMRWLMEPDQQARWVEATGSLPADGAPLDGLSDLLASPAHEPTVAGYDVVQELATEALVQIAGGADPAETLADLTEEANRLAPP